MNVVARRLEAALSLCLFALGGCAAIGFEPLDEQVNPLPQGGDGMSGGISGTFTTGGQGGSAGQGGQGGSGGSGGQGGGGSGGRSGAGGSGGEAGGQGGSGTGGDGGDGGDGGPSNPCEGKSNGSPCDDGLFCTLEFCFAELCLVDERSCSDECNTGTCDETTDQCVYTPRPDDTECGSGGNGVCEEGRCSEPISCTEGGECNPVCEQVDCEYACPLSNSCRPSCIDGADCEVDCEGSIECRLECIDSSCDMQCQDSGSCDMRCSGSATVCAVTCTDPSGCDQSECLDGATCILTCLEDAESCGFKECWTDPRWCDDGITVVCNDDCPGE